MLKFSRWFCFIWDVYQFSCCTAVLYVHMYICTYVYMYICIYVYMYVCTTNSTELVQLLALCLLTVKSQIVKLVKDTTSMHNGWQICITIQRHVCVMYAVYCCCCCLLNVSCCLLDKQTSKQCNNSRQAELTTTSSMRCVCCFLLLLFLLLFLWNNNKATKATRQQTIKLAG